VASFCGLPRDRDGVYSVIIIREIRIHPFLPVPVMPTTQFLDYPAVSPLDEGALIPLANRLVTLTRATDLDLRECRRPWHFALWFRNGARRVFYLKAVRRAGRLLIEMGGVDRDMVLDAVGICRDHFDRMFDVDRDP
jgi:hypothetical protein